MKMKNKYEYKKIWLKYDVNLDDLLEELGSKGWELVTIATMTTGKTADGEPVKKQMVFFKREI